MSTETSKKSQTVAPRILSGMRDFLPERMILRQWVIAQLRTVFESFGFEPLDTPAIEYADTLKGKYGEEADKLIYQFEDRGGRPVGLRYDLTVPLARVVAMYPDLPKPFKRYQIAPVWRAERPQKGRYREFWQCDVDTVGTTSVLADAENLCVVSTVLERLGFSKYTIRLNNRKILTALAQSLGLAGPDALSLFRSLDKLDKIGFDGVRAELAERGLAADIADRVFAFVGTEGPNESILRHLRAQFGDSRIALEGIAELERIVEVLAESGVPAGTTKVDLSMIRGLDYYTGPIVETVVEEPKVGSISGGGRYDNLIEMFSGRSTPATGVSVGLERIIDVIDELGLAPTSLRRTVSDVFVTVFSEDTLGQSLRLVTALRKGGVKTEISLTGDRLQNQLRYASRRSIPFVVILGPDEIANQEIVLKNLLSGDQEKIPLVGAVSRITALMAGS